MKKVFIVCMLLYVGINTNAQTFLSRDSMGNFDSLSIMKGFIRVPFKQLLTQSRFSNNLPLVIDTDSLLEVYYKSIGYADDSINLSTHILLQSYFGGDCHVRFSHSMFLDTVAKKLIWRVYNIYGGCRAAGFGIFVIQVPKPPKGYIIEVEELLVE